jgi:hypothetical protein
MKNASAKRVFIVSFIAIIIQMGYSLLFTNALEVYGVAGTIMPATVTLIGGFLIWYSGKCKSSGILV